MDLSQSFQCWQKASLLQNLRLYHLVSPVLPRGHLCLPTGLLCNVHLHFFATNACDYQLGLNGGNLIFSPAWYEMLLVYHYCNFTAQGRLSYQSSRKKSLVELCNHCRTNWWICPKILPGIRGIHSDKTCIPSIQSLMSCPGVSCTRLQVWTQLSQSLSYVCTAQCVSSHVFPTGY